MSDSENCQIDAAPNEEVAASDSVDEAPTEVETITEENSAEIAAETGDDGDAAASFSAEEASSSEKVAATGPSPGFAPSMKMPSMAAVAEAALKKKKEDSGEAKPTINRTASSVARQRWGLVNKHVKAKGSTFFGIDTEDGDHRDRWDHRRRRMASKRYGTLKTDFSRQNSAVSGKSPGAPPPTFLDAVSAFANAPKTTAHPRYQRYVSDPQRQRINRLQSMGKLHPDALEAAADGQGSEGPRSPPSMGRTLSVSGRSGRSQFRSIRAKESVPKMAWEKFVQKTKATTPSDASLQRQPTARQILERARSFKPSSLLDDFPPKPPSEEKPPSGRVEDVVDGELFFDLSTPTSASPGFRPVKSARLEVGGKGLPGGGIWNVSDKPRSADQLSPNKDDLMHLHYAKVGDRLEKFMDSALKPPKKRQLGMGIVGRILNRTMRSQSRVGSDVKQQLEDIDDHRPFFTYWATTVQVVIMIITLAVYGFAPMGFERKLITGTVQTTNLAHEEVSFYEQQSFWLGPRSSDLIHLGAKYAPCMRRDEKIWEIINRCRSREADSGCCILNDGGGCVQKYKREDCSKTLAVFHKWGDRASADLEAPCINSGPNCEKRKSGPVCGQDPGSCQEPPSVGMVAWADNITEWPICKKNGETSSAPEHMQCEVVGHPCCVGIKGQCRITTYDHCEFLRGYYHKEATLCSQVSCLSDICGMISFADPEKPDQVYRLWTSLFLHGGLLHLIITVIFQYVVMRDLEKMAGPTRIGIIYIGTGFAGNLASLIFLPYQAEVGPSGSQFGLMACLFVEVIQSWPLLLHPWRALFKLIFILLFLFLLGLLPWVDNYSHLFGFVFGFLLSFMFLPYVSIGKFDRKRKILTIVACGVCFVGMFAMLFLLFYVTPIYECKGCSYFNCIPFTDHFCEDMKVEVDLEVDDCQ